MGEKSEPSIEQLRSENHLLRQKLEKLEGKNGKKRLWLKMASIFVARVFAGKKLSKSVSKLVEEVSSNRVRWY